MIGLKLNSNCFRSIWLHLLPNNSTLEQAAFLFCKLTFDDSDLIFTAIDSELMRESDYVNQSTDYFELTDECKSRVIKHANASDCALVELHSHPTQRFACFSHSDKIGLLETVPHMRWRLNNRPYLAIVVAPSSFDALVWPQFNTPPEPLDEVKFGGSRIFPTNYSVVTWKDD